MLEKSWKNLFCVLQFLRKFSCLCQTAEWCASTPLRWESPAESSLTFLAVCYWHTTVLGRVRPDAVCVSSTISNDFKLLWRANINNFLFCYLNGGFRLFRISGVTNFNFELPSTRIPEYLHGKFGIQTSIVWMPWIPFAIFFIQNTLECLNGTQFELADDERSHTVDPSDISVLDFRLKLSSQLVNR